MPVSRHVLALALVACSNPSKLDQEASGSGSQQNKAPTVRHYSPEVVKMVAPPIALPKQEAFIVQDAGKGDKAVLRYTLAPGVVEHHVETKLTSRQLDRGKFSDPIELPPMRDGFAITISDGKPLALRPLKGEISGKSHPLAEAYLSSWRTKLQNRRVDVTFDPRGQFSKVSFNDDPTNLRSAVATDELVQRLLAMAVPLPEVAVGTGAKWQVITVLRQGPAYIKQTATYTLVERTPARWKLHVKLLRVGEEQAVDDPGLPKGATADLIAIFRLLEGDLEIDPTRALIASGKLSVESRVHAKIKLAGQQPVEQFVEDMGSVTFTSDAGSQARP